MTPPRTTTWRSPDRWRNHSGLFQFGSFASHSGFQLPWKIDLDSLSAADWEEVARIVVSKFRFGHVYGALRGGRALAEALRPYCESGFASLIVDDVLTTGRSMEEAKAKMKARGHDSVIGVVVVARGACPPWVWSIMRVEEWAQSRGTGLG